MMSCAKVKKYYQNYSLYTYNRVGPVFVRGKGSWLWDCAGKKYLDLFPGWGVGVLGHCHPAVVKTIGEQSRRLIHLPNNLFFEQQAVLAEQIVKNSFPSRVFFSNSGAESVEGALKITRLFGAGKRYKVITMRDSFHGRTFAAMSATGQAKYRKPFKPVVPGFSEARLNDIRSVRRVTDNKTVAVMLELVQGEGGVNIAGKDFIVALSAWCRKNGMLLIVDEVQTGMGRTGKLFAYEHYGITPDIMVLSKGLGAGFPIGAIVVGRHLCDLVKPGLHASTFGGSPLATAVSKTVFDTIKKERLPAAAAKSGAYLRACLMRLRDKFAFIREVRGMGLMQGMELDVKTFPLFLKIMENRVIVNSTHDYVMRIMPALNVSREEIDRGLKIIEKVFKGV